MLIYDFNNLQIDFFADVSKIDVTHDESIPRLASK